MVSEAKLNLLQRLLPDGLVADARWLQVRGYSSGLRSKYVASGWLEQPARGVFTRPGGGHRWEQFIISLQSLLRQPVAVGGKTALGLQGYAHDVPLGVEESVQLYTEAKLPGWLQKLPLRTAFDVHNARRLFPDAGIAASVDDLPDPASKPARPSTLPRGHGLTTVPWGPKDWPILVSTPERAALELLDELPDNETFESVDLIMEGLTTLSPRRVEELLTRCSSIKVKRLFLWFAERHGQPWLDRIDARHVDTGTGKRVIARGGRLDSKYLITVPEALHGRP
jgi:hypothetical protein